MSENNLQNTEKSLQIFKLNKNKKRLRPFKPRIRLSNDPLTGEEVEKLINSTNNLTDKTLFSIGFYTGMRISEIIELEEINIVKNEGFIRIFDRKKSVYRKVYVPSSILNVCEVYSNYLKEVRSKSPKFFNFTPATAENKIHYWTEKILGKKKSWHAVRHTYITLSQEKNIPISLVMENTGDSANTILQYYTKLSPQFIKKKINEVELFKV